MITIQVKDASKVWWAMILGHNGMSDLVQALEHVTLLE